MRARQWYSDGNGRYRFNDEYVGPITMPAEHLTTCDFMFAGCEIKIGCYLADFDTSEVTSMQHMFDGAKLPSGFGFGELFDTHNVKDMGFMFHNSRFARDFTLGPNFDTSNVESMYSMFCGVECVSFEPFKLGEKFDTRNVIDMGGMFEDSKFYEGLDLGEKFDTSKVEYMV